MGIEFKKVAKWNEKQSHCPVEVSMNLLSGKWKCLMLWHLNDGTKRYNELEKIVPGVSQKMLTQQLKELEKDGLISRTVYPETPPRVEYSLSKLGESTFPVLELMHSWAVEQLGLSDQEDEALLRKKLFLWVANDVLKPDTR